MQATMPLAVAYAPREAVRATRGKRGVPVGWESGTGRETTPDDNSDGTEGSDGGDGADRGERASVAAGASGSWDIISSTGPLAIRAVSATGRALAEQLFTAQYPKLAGWIRRLVDDDETAHEIASEAFTRLLSRWTKPGSLESPQGYLYMIATNLVRDHWRKMERERRAIRTVISGSEAEPTSDPAQDVDVRELLMTLPPKLREPFLLHYYAGFGVREIALLLSRPEGTIKADLYHARTKLRESIEARSAVTGGRQASPKRRKARDAG
jgi:RNA polymerase sigma-70 factor, ECF subfamily